MWNSKGVFFVLLFKSYIADLCWHVHKEQGEEKLTDVSCDVKITCDVYFLWQLFISLCSFACTAPIYFVNCIGKASVMSGARWLWRILW